MSHDHEPPSTNLNQDTGIPELDILLRIQRETERKTDSKRKNELEKTRRKLETYLKLKGLYE